MRVVIIGGGSAGVSAATHLRRQDENAEIIILEKTKEFAISSCGLPYLIEGKVKDKDEIIGASVEQMRDLFKIDVRLNTEVISIKHDKKLLNLGTNGKLIYDHLILATGAIQLRPDISGILSDNVFTLNNLHSTQRIINYFYELDAKNVIILGGGFIGIRVAEALLNNGAKVTLIEKSNQILNEFDYDFAQMIKHKLKAKGLEILTSTIVKEFKEDKIILSNSEKIKYAAFEKISLKSKITIFLMKKNCYTIAFCFLNLCKNIKKVFKKG
jgi:NADPH-dependent 2,4-dienoyl-CoA reductase/sulfur reductase-like enzyme